MQKNVLIIDAMNAIHRAKVGWEQPDGVIAACMRSIRALLNKFLPDITYFVLEGKPVRRIELSEGTYKAQRVEAEPDFWRQQAEIVRIISTWFPIRVVRHPQFEADDIIAHLARHYHSRDNVVVASTDTDFIQLLDETGRIRLYSPVKDHWQEHTAYNYVQWKALRGDGADNIPGIPGIGAKRAEKLLMQPGALERFFNERPGTREIYEHGVKMILFEDVSKVFGETTCSNPHQDNVSLRETLRSIGLNTVTSDERWPAWISPIDKLWKSHTPLKF